MTAQVLDGRTLAKEMQSAIQTEVGVFAAQHGTPPRLLVVQVAGDESSERYVRSINRACEKAGMAFVLDALAADVSQAALDASITQASSDPAVHAVLLQLPLPKHLDSDRAVMCLNHARDVDGIHPINAGLLAQGRPAFVPNTPAGGMALLEHYQVPLSGRRAAVVGRSTIVGRPMAALLLQAHATVTICHTRTPDLGAVLRECDIVVAAAGRAGLVTGEMLRPGAVVVDFGINVLEDGSMVGDVDVASAAEVAGYITPVPGGTGPMTNVMLLKNVLRAARQQVRGEQA